MSWRLALIIWCSVAAVLLIWIGTRKRTSHILPPPDKACARNTVECV